MNTKFTDNDIMSLAYDCNAMPECCTDESLLVFARVLMEAERNRLLRLIEYTLLAEASGKSLNDYLTANRIEP